jgi:hypothetical protein
MKNSQRVATVLIFLSEVDEGGGACGRQALSHGRARNLRLR